MDWQIVEEWEGAEDLARRLGVSKTIAQILYNRGIKDFDAAISFLRPNLSNIIEPEEIPDLIEATERIYKAIKEKEKIIIYGDYDVDGITGAAILWQVLKKAGANVGYYIPNRIEEGYGLNKSALRKLISEDMKLLITVDCGIRAIECVEFANLHNVDVIITDHHEPAQVLPPAYAIVHPLRSSTYTSQPALPCGATVAFKLAWSVARRLNGSRKVADDFRQLMVELTALVAIATVADIVPLVGENRILTKFGTKQLEKTNLVGLRALIESAKLSNSNISSFHIGFILAPRINAAGRMGDAEDAFKLLTTDDPQQAAELAKILERKNRTRQKIEEQITSEAIELINSQGALNEQLPILVLAKEKWHPGVIGIVASRLTERFGKPVVMISIKGNIGQGSARSIEGYDINMALEACKDYLITFGGHSMAAGLKIEASKIIPFMEALQRHASMHIEEKTKKPKIKIDAIATAEELTLEFINHLQLLSPFGYGNPRPILATEIVELIDEPRITGSSGKHISFNVKWKNKIFRAIAFNQSDMYQVMLDNRRCRLAFEPIVNSYNGLQSIELKVFNIKPL